MIVWARCPYEGQVALVTGAGSGIGRSIAQGFLEQGAIVAVLGRSAEPIEETMAGFPPEKALVLVADVTSRSAVESAVAGIIERFGRIDVVISNACTSEPIIIEDFEDAAWERMRRVNLDAFVTLARAAIPALKPTWGNIVAISSISSIRGDWKQFAYNASKGAINAVVQPLAQNMGTPGIRVNAVAPAFTTSKLTAARLANPEFAARLMDRIALEWPATPADFARTVLFLASPDAGYITGITPRVDGGATASSGTQRAL